MKNFLRKTGMITGLLLFAVSNSFAVEIGSKELTISTTLDYVSRYIWRGQDLYGNNDGAFQPSVDISISELAAGTSFGINVWGSFASTDGHETGDELDYTVYFAKDIFEGTVSTSWGFTYFDFPNLNDMSDVAEPWFSLALNEIPGLDFPLSFFVFAGYDFKATSGGPDEGWYFSWGFDSELGIPDSPLTQEGQTLALGIVNWGNDGVAGMESSSLYATEFSISTAYGIGEIEISPNVHYVINHKENINSGDEEIWFGINLSYTF